MPDVGSQLIVALDFSGSQQALALARQLDPQVVRVKVGKELFTVAGPQIVTDLQNLGFEVFLDLKFHDIPNTVAKAISAAADLGVWMVNVHASGGLRMMQAAREAADATPRPPLLIAVTVLTSMTRDDMMAIGWQEDPQYRVSALAALAEQAGMDGVVCSAQEAAMLRTQRREDFLLVTPGIRLPGESAGDQRRVVTPADALAAGATHIVMGRSITGASSPANAVSGILASLGIN